MKYISKAFWQLGDVFIINGSIHGLAMIVIPKFVSLSSKAQSGFVYHYALVMIIGFSLILSTFVFFESGGVRRHGDILRSEGNSRGPRYA